MEFVIFEKELAVALQPTTVATCTICSLKSLNHFSVAQRGYYGENISG
jgi:hypothetical protein